MAPGSLSPVLLSPSWCDLAVLDHIALRLRSPRIDHHAFELLIHSATNRQQVPHHSMPRRFSRTAATARYAAIANQNGFAIVDMRSHCTFAKPEVKFVR